MRVRTNGANTRDGCMEIPTGRSTEIKSISAQACSVHRPLMAAETMSSAWHRVVFDDEGSYIESKASGRRMWMRESNGMYVLGLWVKTSGFQRQNGG